MKMSEENRKIIIEFEIKDKGTYRRMMYHAIQQEWYLIQALNNIDKEK